MAIPVNQQTANADRAVRNTGLVAPAGFSQPRPFTRHRASTYSRVSAPATRARIWSPAG